jgi:hypothetical protein
VWCSAFSEESKMVYFNLLEPMYLNVGIGLNHQYNYEYKNEPFKYRVVVLNSKVILSVTPALVKDLF